MDRIREIHLRRAELFLDKSHFSQLNIHQNVFKKRDGTAVQLSVWSAPMDNDQLPPKFHEAIQQEYGPAKVGDEFGPSWSTHWFKISIKVPQDEGWSEGPLVFRWDSGCEAMVWSSTGVPCQAFSEQERDEFQLCLSAKPGDTFTFYIEMAVNGMFGTGGDENRRARIHAAEIVIIDSQVRAFMDSLRIVVDVASLLGNCTRGQAALTKATEAIEKLDLKQPTATIREAQAILDGFLAVKGAAERFKVTAVGHCHIDTAWLWRYRETKRKCARSWASQLRLLERYPAFVFACPQMQQFEWLRIDYPDLFEEIRARVKEGRFIPIGGSWVEMDGNMPSGESFVRHFLYGQQYMLEHFGTTSQIFWLPDTFGYNAQLPQLMSLAGMPYFLTQKLSWSNINKFPHHSFKWEGLDGTRVLAHFPPADTYTSGASIGDVIKSEKATSGEAGLFPQSMMVFGHGDGGGGPTDAMLRRLAKLSNIDGLPRVEISGPLQFYKDMSQVPVLPVWRGELYLELHRGTLTSQAKTKYYNRRCEGLMREVELISTVFNIIKNSLPAHSLERRRPPFEYPKEEIGRLWKLVLLNQFHDVLPGSSIEEVYHDVSQIYQDVEYQASRLRELAIRALFGLYRPTPSTDSSGMGGIVFFNSVPFARSDIVVVPFDPDPNSPQPGVIAVKGIPPLSMASFDSHRQTSKNEEDHVHVDSLDDSRFYLENGYVRVEVDQQGRIVRFYDKSANREVIDPAHPANSFWIYEDKPNSWDAWDVEMFYRGKGKCVDAETRVEIGMRGPLLASLVRTTKISATSTMTQIISLSCLGTQIEFYCSIDWAETHQFLRVLHPVNIRSDHATYETAFGQVKRPTHQNTTWDAAQFECCAHRYVDLSEHGYGVALLNDSKYGFSVEGNVMGMSLLRAPKYPDPTCDQSRHIIRYALWPHTGSAEEACVVGEAYKFNNPLRFTSAPTGSYDPSWLDHPFLGFTSGGEVDYVHPPLVLDTIKMAEKTSNEAQSSVIIRAYEPAGGRGTARLLVHPILRVTSISAADLLERDQPSLVPIEQSGDSWMISYKPYQIITLKLQVAVDYPPALI